jgi:hypothetical protein
LSRIIRFIKKRLAASLWFRSAEGALRTIDGYEAMHLNWKGRSGGCQGAMWSGNVDSFMPCLESLRNSTLNTATLTASPGPFATDPPLARLAVAT